MLEGCSRFLVAGMSGICGVKCSGALSWYFPNIAVYMRNFFA